MEAWGDLCVTFLPKGKQVDGALVERRHLGNQREAGDAPLHHRWSVHEVSRDLSVNIG